MNLKKLITVSVAMAFSVAGIVGVCQDDLDDLLNDLEKEGKPAEKAEAKPAPADNAEEEEETVVEEKGSEEPKEEASKAEAKEEVKEESSNEKAEATEEKAEDESVEEETAEEEITEEASDEKETVEESKEETVVDTKEEKAPEAKEEKTEEATEEEATAEEESEEEATKEETEEKEPTEEELVKELTKEETVEEKPVAKAEEKPEAKIEKKPAEKSVEPVKEVAKEESLAPVADDEVLSLLEELSSETKAEAVREDAPKAVAAKEPATKTEATKTEVAKKDVAEEKPVAKAEETSSYKPTYNGKDAELIAQIYETEAVRRKAYDAQAKRIIKQARECMNAKEYMEAAKQYRIAQKLLNDSPATKALSRECSQGLAEGIYRAALQEEAIGRRERAIKLMNQAVDLRHPKARRQLEQWNKAGNPEDTKVDVSEISHRQNEADYKESRAKNVKHLRRARQLLGTKELDKALDECELVLISDPYNQEAIRIRNQIVRKMHTIVAQERKAARDGMMADVDKAWRPVYAVDAREIEKTAGQTLTTNLDKDPERAQEQIILKRMRDMKLPEISFKPPATIYDAVQFFIGASKDFDRPDLPIEERGFGFMLKNDKPMTAKAADEEDDAEGFGAEEGDSSNGAAAQGVAVIPTISVNNISFYDALTLICESVGYKFKVQNGIVVVMPKGMSTEEMVTRSYPVVSAFMERMSSASSEMKEMKASGFGGGNSKKDDSGEENTERDWKEFFTMLGVQWPEGSSIMYIKTIGKLRVRNTYENLAELEKALTEMNADPKLIEIEARFVEVCQEDLNSLGFEWILNSDYSLGLNKGLGRILGIQGGRWGDPTKLTPDTMTTKSGHDSEGVSQALGTYNNGLALTGATDAISAEQASIAANGNWWVKTHGQGRAAGINRFGGEGATYQNGNRYLSTLSNHISGEGYSTNDQFMRVNAFLGKADLSMILHMLSQRSDTDLLSAPKVLTKPGEEAVMKVVTEYIYPTDYDVQLQSSSSSSGGSSSGGSQSAILAVVEPQSFTMREVGVILDVTPTLTDDGNLIDLKLNTQVVDEPTWKNYGMRIPFTGNSSLQSFQGIGEIFTGLGTVLGSIGEGLQSATRQMFAEQAVNSATSALDNLSKSGSDNMTYYDAPMEQPFFHVRSIDSSVSVYPGATIVMGGLITEARKAMDDKIPFLGDLPFIGRFFRSHSEQTNKRNLLIFVTTRLVDVRGREIAMGSLEAEKDKEAKPAPEEQAEK